MGYTKDAIKGVSWMGAFRVTTRVVTIARTIILARILTPSQFGVVGIAMLVLGLVETLTETGINVFLIQEEKIKKHINTAWIVSIARGFIIAGVIFASSPAVSGFFNNPDSRNLLYLIALVPVIRGFINPATISFQKNLTFSKEFWFRTSIFSADSATAILLAYFTREASSLVFGFIVGALFEVVLSFIVTRPIPKFEFNRARFKEVLHHGKWVTAYSALNYAFQNGDNIVVGRILGTYELGLYQIGYRVANLPSEATDVISRVTFPIYTKIARSGKERLKAAFIKTTLLVCLGSLVFGIVLIIFTESLVLIFLGEKWIAVSPALRVLAILGVVRAITSTTSPLFLSVKKQNYVSALTLAAVLGLSLTIIPFVVRFGIIGAGLAALFGSVLVLPLALILTLKVFKER